MCIRVCACLSSEIFLGDDGKTSYQQSLTEIRNRREEMEIIATGLTTSVFVFCFITVS